MTAQKSTTQASGTAKTDGAHNRINVPLNLDNWRHLEAATQESLLWFHQYVLDTRMSYDEAHEAIGYDQSTIFRVLKGQYTGSLSNVCKAIAGYKKLVAKRATIQTNEIVGNNISKLIGAGLDYALSNNSITTITGESRMGKTVAVLKWREENSLATSVYVAAPPVGGTKMFMRRIADAVGVNKNMSVAAMFEEIIRSFNRNRILLVDEAHRLVPSSRRSNPTNIELLRDLHDTTHCGLAMIATQRFTDDLQRSEYQFEQVLGRIGMPVRLKRKILLSDFMPIVQQYIPKPSRDLIAECDRIANDLGRLGILVETLRVASRIAAKEKATLKEAHIFRAIKLRAQMMGESNSRK